MTERKCRLQLFRRWRGLSAAVFTRFTPAAFEEHPEILRRARLIIGFAVLGDFFGSSFAGFYLLIHHVWGAAIVSTCCLAFTSIPFVLRKSSSPDRAGNLYCFILNAGFFCLCLVEGGIRGHALAWLVTVPLLALLLTSKRAAYAWGAVAVGGAALVAGAEFTQYAPPILYAPEWHNLVSALGYISLVAFMFILGLIFETGRAEALKRMHQTLRALADANQHLMQLNQEKNEFLGIAAHDLKNPLTVVMSYSDLILMENASHPRLARCASAIKTESARMRDLISNLLDLNAIESGCSQLKVIPVEISALMRRAVENQGPVAQKKQMRLSCHASQDKFLTMADANALLQVVDNLISNALKFSNPGTEVKVTLAREGERVLLRVSDQGPGIAAADREKLFRRFAKLSARPTAGESSNGLGLSIVKRLVEGMNGRIECLSEIGQGTTFAVSLAAAASPAVPQTIDRRGVPSAEKSF